MVLITDLLDPNRFNKEQYIRLLYEVILQRPPDAKAFDTLMDRSDSHNFFKEMISCPEFRLRSQSSNYIPGLRLSSSDKPRILMCGAYGNGNLGDKIQAQSLARLINGIRPDVEVWASSALRAAYPFAFDRVLPAEALSRPLVVNQFDMLIIGGGGLLAHPHDPLTTEDWQKAIDIPVAIIGVGAAVDVVMRSEILVRKAFYVSVRDEHSMSSMLRFIRNVSFVPDPVLCDGHYDARNGARPAMSPAIRSDTHAAPRKLWILKFGPTDQIEQCRSLIDPENDQVCFLEPPLDFPLLRLFPSARPIYRTGELLQLIDDADMVVSMRYHGYILAMLRQRPCIAIREHKCLDLCRRYGNEPFFVRNASDISFDMAAYRAPDDLLLSDRARFKSELSSVLSTLSRYHCGSMQMYQGDIDSDGSLS